MPADVVLVVEEDAGAEPLRFAQLIGQRFIEERPYFFPESFVFVTE